MPSRLAKFSLKKSIVSWSAAFSFCALAILSLSARAEVTVNPQNAGYNEEDITFYYAGSSGDNPGTVDDNSGANPGYIAPSATFFDFSIGSDLSTATNSQMLVFNVFSSAAPSAGVSQTTVLVVKIDETDIETSGDQFVMVPIAAVGDKDGSIDSMTACTESTNCLFSDVDPDSDSLGSFSDYRFAVQYSGEVKIGIYLRDLCEVVAGLSLEGNLDLCQASSSTGGPVVSPTASDAGEVSLIFSTRVTDGVSIKPVSNTSEDDSSTIKLNFHSVPPDFSCTDSSIYFPGDGKIVVNTDLVSASIAGGGAPALNVAVIGANGTTIDNSEAGFASNAFFDEVEITSGDQEAGSFVNSTSAESGAANEYNVAFSVRDRAGLIGEFNISDTTFDTGETSSTNCYVTGVRTAEILGFVRDGNCFIATATYQDPNAWQVELLRSFRDQVLREFSWGNRFVLFYYENSPEAANWLMGHAWARPVVQLALAPVILFAWLLMNPIAIVGSGAAGVFAWLSWRQFRKVRNA